MPRCPQRFGRRLLLLRRWLCSVHRRMPRHLSGTPCRTASRNESRAIPSLCRATPSATSERFLGLLDRRESLRLRCFLRSFQLRSLSSAGITRLHRSYGPLRHPIRPGLALASCQLILTAITAGASRVASGPFCLHAVASTPAGSMKLVRSYRSINIGLPSITSGSAPASLVSGLAQRSPTVVTAYMLARPPFSLHRRLRRLCCLHRRSDCYRVERTSSRAGLSPAVDQRFSRRTVNSR